MALFDRALDVISGEWVLNSRPNGGGAIVRRALWITFLGYSVAVALRCLLQTGFSTEFDWMLLRTTIAETIPWAGAILGGSYAALYARFASQWQYLGTRTTSSWRPVFRFLKRMTRRECICPGRQPSSRTHTR